MYFFNSGSIVSLFIAGVLGFVVAPRIALFSRVGGLAMRLAAGSLVVGAALEFGGPIVANVLYRLQLPFEPMQLIPTVVGIFFWGFLAWSVLGTVQSAPAKGTHS